MRLAAPIAYIGGLRNSYKLFIGKPEENN